MKGELNSMVESITQSSLFHDGCTPLRRDGPRQIFRRFLVPLLVVLFVWPIIACGKSTFKESKDAELEEESTRQFVARVLEANRSFVARGTVHCNYVGRTPYQDPVSLGFDLEHGYFFSYEPADLTRAWSLVYFANRPSEGSWTDRFAWKPRQVLTINTMTGYTRPLGFPLHPVFNFCWGLFQESTNQPGFRTFLTNSLMRVRVERHATGSELILTRRWPFLPVRRITFVFNHSDRLTFLKLLEADGSSHVIEVHPVSTPYTRFVMAQK
jgi:hypothetical protein